MKHMPFPNSPSNENMQSLQSLVSNEEQQDVPWVPLRSTDAPHPMFAIHFVNGRVVSFSYADLREVAMRDAGMLRLYLVGFEKTVITIEGRFLKTLQPLFSQHRVKSLEENGPRLFDRPEEKPTVEKISVEVVV